MCFFSRGGMVSQTLRPTPTCRCTVFAASNRLSQLDTWKDAWMHQFKASNKDNITKGTSLKTKISPWKMLVGRLFSFWNGPFSGDMLIFGGYISLTWIWLRICRGPSPIPLPQHPDGHFKTPQPCRFAAIFTLENGWHIGEISTMWCLDSTTTGK